MKAEVKQEQTFNPGHLTTETEPSAATASKVRKVSVPPKNVDVIDLSSSGSDNDDSDDEQRSNGEMSLKRARVSGTDAAGGSSPTTSFKRQKDAGMASKTAADVLPIGILERDVTSPPPGYSHVRLAVRNYNSCKQFWKAGDYEGAPSAERDTQSGGMDHARVHPKFLHSNATSHKWALGAFAELLDNALDEVCHGATFVNVDMLVNKKDKSRMLLIEDNGGGMDPDKLRKCMSLGYSAKSKMANTIGQYGNGFKTSTMRLGADVIVFTRCSGYGGSSTQSIGLLSYTFLRCTGKEDIVVPILDYKRKDGKWQKITRSSAVDWNKNVDTIVQWSPFASEAELLQQFYMVKEHGTRIIIYNLWEDDQGQLELDFDSDQNDIQIRGVNRDEKNIEMAKQYPNSKHFLTYRHSLRNYASILYLRRPPNFRVVLRGKDVEHHNIVNDMMMSKEVTYRPQAAADGVPRDNMVAIVTIGFVKDAEAHIDVQGFNVYHKNRLIKPFWRVWNAAGSDGRGVIGVLEANFVEPAHDKQGFERTTVLARLESKLLTMQKQYWTSQCHKIGYAPRVKNVKGNDYVAYGSAQSKGKSNGHDGSNKKGEKSSGCNKYSNGKGGSRGRLSRSSPESSEASSEEDEMETPKEDNGHRKTHKSLQIIKAESPEMSGNFIEEGAIVLQADEDQVLVQLKEENRQLRERLSAREELILGELQRDLQSEKERRILLEKKLRETEEKLDELNKEQESLIDIFSEERDRRDIEEEKLRKKLMEASKTIQELQEKLRLLEKGQ